MKTVFISDLHLSEQHSNTINQFAYLLDSLKYNTDALYILGDFFTMWIGDDEQTEFQQKISSLLKESTKYYPIYFLPGNRDFLLGKHYCEQSGMQYLKDPSVIQLYGKLTLLTHGDGLCTQDRLFQNYRRVTQSQIFKRIFLNLPLSLRKRIALRFRTRSFNRNQRISNELMDIEPTTLKKLMQENHCDQAIYGHTHRPSIWYFNLAQNIKKVFVLSDWNPLGHYLIIRPESNDGESRYFD